MKKILLLCLLALNTCMMAWSAAAPLHPVASGAPVLTLVQPPETTSITTPHLRKPSKLQKHLLKILERKLARQGKATASDKTKGKRTIGAIALGTGIGAAVLLFLIPAVALILVPVAIITGIIGLSNNSDQKSRTHSLIGLILGIVAIFVMLLAILFWVSGWGFWLIF